MINSRIFQPFFKGALCGLEGAQKEGSPHQKLGRRRKDQWVYFLGSQSAFRYGEELIIDLLNDYFAFFPFEMESTSNIRIINKKYNFSFHCRGFKNRRGSGEKGTRNPDFS